MKLDYFLYMNEAEGTNFVNTRTARINAAIKDFIIMAEEGYDINNDDIQAVILEDHKIGNITHKEIDYITKKVEERFKCYIH